MKTAFRLALVIISLFFGSATCGKPDSNWVQKGTIQMDKLISIDSLWKKKDALVGKIVTLELGPSASTYNGNSDNIKGTCYYHTGMHFHTMNLFDRDSIIPFLKRSNISFKNGDTLFLGLYGVNIANKGNVNEVFPDWIQYNKPIVSLKREDDIYPMTESSKKIVTGFLLGYYLNTNELTTVENYNLFYMSRYLEIYPLGIKYIGPKKDK